MSAERCVPNATACGPGRMQYRKYVGAVGRKLMALRGALVHELYRLTEEEVGIVEVR
jgi:hypothetical protein